MAQFLVKVADEQGNLRQQVEHGFSEAEVHDRFTQQGYLVYWVKPRTLLSRGQGGARQVPNHPRVALVTNGGGPVPSAVLLVRQ